MSFQEHFKRMVEKASWKVAALCSLMHNLGGPSESNKRIMMNATVLVLLYRAPIWAEATAVPDR